MPLRFQLPELRVPIVQAPMAGGLTTPALVTAVSGAGGLGSLPGAYRTPAQMEEDIAAVRAQTEQPFALNLFAPGAEHPLSGDSGPALEFVQRWHERLGLPPAELPKQAGEPWEEQFAVALAAKVPVLSVTFGLIPPEWVERFHAEGTFLIGTATTVEEARQLEHSGVDAVVAQSSEAGAHRGTFAGSFESSLVGGIALIPQVVDAVRIPVIASGGIMDGRGIVAALALGAQAVQMGTAFLTTGEAGSAPVYRQALLRAKEDATTLTTAFSGRPARGIRNAFLNEMEADGRAPLPYPWQNALTRTLRRAGAAQGNADVLSLWAGQGVPLVRARTAAALMKELEQEIQETLTRLSGHPLG